MALDFLKLILILLILPNQRHNAAAMGLLCGAGMVSFVCCDGPPIALTAWSCPGLSLVIVRVDPLISTASYNGPVKGNPKICDRDK